MRMLILTTVASLIAEPWITIAKCPCGISTTATLQFTTAEYGKKNAGARGSIS